MTILDVSSAHVILQVQHKMFAVMSLESVFAKKDIQEVVAICAVKGISDFLTVPNACAIKLDHMDKHVTIMANVFANRILVVLNVRIVLQVFTDIPSVYHVLAIIVDLMVYPVITMGVVYVSIDLKVHNHI
jgi:hypothetical protein